jgi:hypothetical protein
MALGRRAKATKLEKFGYLTAETQRAQRKKKKPI